jgi:glycosyltransferase involved in cell wall biosynthesis
MTSKRSVNSNQTDADSVPVVVMIDPGNYIPYYNEHLAKSLIAAGCKVKILTSEFTYAARAEDGLELPLYFSYLKSWQRKSRLLRSVVRGITYPLGHLKALRYILAKKVGVVHLQWSRMPVWDLVFIMLCNLLGRKTVFTVHDVEPLYKWSGSRWVSQWLMASCATLIVHSRWARERLLDLYEGFDRKTVEIIPHGPMTQGATVSQRSAREVLGVQPDSFVLTFFGSIKPFKGYKFLNELIPYLAGRNKNIEVLVAGKPGSPAIEAEIQDAMQSYAGKVHLKLNYVPDEEADLYYQAADLVLLPYENISQSGVMASAMAHGKAVLATPVGNFPELVKQGKFGFICPADLSEWVVIIENLAKDPLRCRQMGEAFQEWGSEHLSWQKVGQQTVKTYRLGAPSYA